MSTEPKQTGRVASRYTERRFCRPFTHIGKKSGNFPTPKLKVASVLRYLRSYDFFNEHDMHILIGTWIMAQQQLETKGNSRGRSEGENSMHGDRCR